MQKQGSFWRSLGFKIGAYFLIYGLILSLVSYLGFRLLLYPRVVNEVNGRLIQTAQMAANVLAGNNIEKFVATSSASVVNTPDYKRYEKRVREMAASWDEIDSIYVLEPTKDPNEFLFVLDSTVEKDLNGNGVIDDSEKKAKFGEKYDASKLPAMKQGMSVPSIDKEPNTDKWGTFVSSYAPIKDEKGKSIALVGVDLRASHYFAMLNSFNFDYFYLTLIFVQVSLLLGIFMSRLVSSPVNKLVGDLGKLNDSDGNMLVEQGENEIRILRSEINKMRTQILAAKQGLESEVAAKTADLKDKLDEVEKMNRLMINREVKMIELKKKLMEKNV